ncbi:hypothetical protein EIP86_004505 [Pleurotus ostreatoroseus]|nr:hypothetical protein EIP86_004505 [Pleurotus ostreatoroseus]
MTPRVRFDAQLAVPPANRPRLGVRYPAVAQNKDRPDRGLFKDLKWERVAAALESEAEREVEEGGHARQPENLDCNAPQEDADSHAEAIQPMYATRSSIRKLLEYACEALFDMTSAQNARPPSKHFHSHLSLQVPHWGGHRHRDLSQCSSRTVSTTYSSASSSSSSATTPSSDVGSTIRPWS